MDNEWLKGLKAGDDIIIESTRHDVQFIEKVDRITGVNCNFDEIN